MSVLCQIGLHRKRWRSFEGADHTGVDAYLCCTRCTLRTEQHVECHEVTPEIRRMLDGEWDAGRLTRKAIVL